MGCSISTDCQALVGDRQRYIHRPTLFYKYSRWTRSRPFYRHLNKAPLTQQIDDMWVPIVFELLSPRICEVAIFTGCVGFLSNYNVIACDCMFEEVALAKIWIIVEWLLAILGQEVREVVVVVVRIETWVRDSAIQKTKHVTAQQLREKRTIVVWHLNYYCDSQYRLRLLIYELRRLPTPTSQKPRAV